MRRSWEKPKRTEEKLMGGEEKSPHAAEMMETMMDGVCVIGLDSKIIKVNAALEKLTGYTKDELIGEVPIKVFPKGETKRILAWIRECREKGFIKNFETVFLRKDKKEIPIILNSTCAKDAEGKPKWMIVAFRDITELKRAEEERLKATVDKQRMEELEKFAKIAVGRELKMVELKKEIEELKRKLEAKG